MKTVFMFPGQGSQSIGMMSELISKYDVARQTFEEASSKINVDLFKIAMEGPENLINQTEITQPIVLTASIAVWRVWLSLTNMKPDYVCGHSLGEYSALVASGVINFENAISLVHLRGQLMQAAVPEGEGAMAALLGIDDSTVIQVCRDASEGEVVAAANFNSPGQVVISGTKSALERAMILAKERGARRATLLAVSVPCHCDLLKPAGSSLAAEMQSIQFKPPSIPIVQNVSAKEVTDLEELKSNLIDHLHRPVLWAQSIAYLAKNNANCFVECGPGKVLTGLNRRINKELRNLNLNDPDSALQILGEIG